MTRSVEATGRNVAEATAKALRELGVPAGQADVTVISRGRSKFFGLIKGTPAKVRVVHKASIRDRAETLVQDLLRRMRFSVQLEVAEQKHALHINIDTVGADELLVGKGGLTLDSLEYIVNRLLQQDDRKGYRVVLDVGGYRRQHGHQPQPEDEPRRGRRQGRPERGSGGRGGGQRRGEPGGERAGDGRPEPAGVAGARPSGRRRSGRGRRRRGSGGRPRPESKPATE